MTTATIAVARLIELGVPKRQDWAFAGPCHNPPPKPADELLWLQAQLDTARMALRLASNPVVDRSYASARDRLSLRLKVARVSDHKRLEVLDLYDRVADIVARQQF